MISHKGAVVVISGKRYEVRIACACEMDAQQLAAHMIRRRVTLKRVIVVKP